MFVWSLLVLCPASLSHTEKESGEMRIQFWSRVPISWHSQSDCRTVLTSWPLFEKDCNANLKGPREGQSVGPGIQPVINEATYPFGVG